MFYWISLEYVSVVWYSLVNDLSEIKLFGQYQFFLYYAEFFFFFALDNMSTNKVHMVMRMYVVIGYG